MAAKLEICYPTVNQFVELVMHVITSTVEAIPSRYYKEMSIMQKELVMHE
jgi:hypothetical protein